MRFSALGKWDKKAAVSHQETSGIRLGDFVQVKLLTRASVENPVLNQATVHLLAGWQTTTLAAAIPNANRELNHIKRKIAISFRLPICIEGTSAARWLTDLDTFTIIPTSASTAESDPIVVRQTATTRLVFKPLLVKNPHDAKASVKGTFVFQRKTPTAHWEDHNVVSLSKFKAGEWTKLELSSEELLIFLQHMAAFYRANARYGLPRDKIHFLKVDLAEARSGGLSKVNFKRLFDLSRRTGIDGFSQLLDWVTDLGNAEEFLSHLKRLEINTLQRLNGLIGLTSLKAALNEWKVNQRNSSEEFWQKLFADHSFILSQVFCLPTFILGGKMYVGGKAVNNTGGHLVDFLVANPVTKNCAIIEIKTPSTKLLGKKFRADVYSPSEDLTGTITQVLNYRLNLLTHYNSLTSNSGRSFEVFAPACLVIAGHATHEFTSDYQCQSFELVRNSLKDVVVVTFDELFAKTDALINALEGNRVSQSF